MMARTASAVLAVLVGPVHAIQYRQESRNPDVYTPRDLNPGVFIQMGKKDTKKRGSWCLNGDAPGFLLATNKSSTSWIISLQGGGWCNTEDECAYRTHADMEQSKPTAHMALPNYGEFQEYNRVTVWYCDGGLYGGNRDEPVSWPDPFQPKKNITMYFRGKRIMDHIIDELKDKYGLKKAEKVMLTGGSAGGLAIFRMSDYISAQMPSSVKTFRAVPQSGWWSSVGGVREDAPDVEDVLPSANHSGAAAMRNAFRMHNMWESIPPSCFDAYAKEDRWQCIYADIAYEHSKTPMFIMNVLDMFVALQNQTTADEAKHDSYCVLKSLKDWACTSKSITRLNSHLNGILDTLRGTWKFKAAGEGGFFSTCSFHAFYGFEEFWNYARDGVTMAEAVMGWWSGVNADAKWYLPCELNTSPPYQCESTCDFQGSGVQFSTPPPNDLVQFR